VSAASYLVACDFSLEHFEHPRAGVAVAREVHAEARRLGRADDRVRTTRLRRTATTVVTISVELTAPTPWAAFDLGAAILRTAVHASGGTTAGWEQLRPHVLPAASRRRARSGVRPPVRLDAPGDWGSFSAAARQRIAALPALPPLRVPSTDTVIDLRSDAA
jgi:hypothetical protein